MALLARVSKMLNASHDVEELLTHMMDAVLESLNAQRGFVILGKGERRKIAVTRARDRQSLAEFSYSRTVVDAVFKAGEAVLSTDAGTDQRFAGSESLHGQKIRSVLCAPLRSKGQIIGAIYLDTLLTAGLFQATDGELLEILCDMSVTALERAHYIQRTLDAEAKQRQHLKEVILSATGGKLKVFERNELDRYLETFTPVNHIPLVEPEDVGVARRSAEALFADQLGENRMHDLVLCISEGATNVVRHGQGGSMSLGTVDGRAVAYFADHGPGIDPESLPKATLMRGFSTKVSMGFGFSVLLQLLDGIVLHSGKDGTHLILELSLEPGRSFEEELLDQLAERLG